MDQHSIEQGGAGAASQHTTMGSGVRDLETAPRCVEKGIIFEFGC